MEPMSKRRWREFDTPEAVVRSNSPVPIKDKAKRNVRVQRVKAGKKGKIVTSISGLELGNAEAITLLKHLKACCGTGGTIKGDTLELQGDQMDVLLELLNKEGYKPKKSGG